MKMTRPFLFAAALLLLGCSDRQTPPPPETTPPRASIAEAMFQERCKKAGEFIHQTVKDVEGIVLLKIRSNDINFANQYTLTDPYGHDVGGEGYIQTFLQGRNEKGGLVEKEEFTNGYHYVDVVDEKTGNHFRYTGALKAVGKKDVLAPNVQFNLKRDPNTI